MATSHSDKDKKEVNEYLKRRRSAQATRPIVRFIRPKKTKVTMQHDLARNLLIGFLVLIIVVLTAVYMYDRQFCPNVKECGDSFVNIKVVIDSLLDFGAPFIGIIIGFFFSEKFRGRDKDDE